jgi:TorA maturation chaperone TorD
MQETAMDSADVSQSEEGGLAGEEAARANLYALIGRLFYDAPDELLLATISRSDPHGDGGPLGAAWRELREACRTTFPVVLKQEFDNLFVGVGKSEITPYTSHYVKGTSPDQHLVRLRALLADWELARRDAASEPEDHVSGLCDVMRHLVSEGYSFDDQKAFYREFVHSELTDLCEAIERSPNASFYRRVAQFTRAFLAIENGGFEMEDA